MRRRTTTRRTGELPESTSSMFPPAHSAWDYITTPLNLLTTSTRLFIGIFNVPVHQVPRARVRGRTRPDHPAVEERSQSEDPAGQGGLTQKYMKIQIHKKLKSKNASLAVFGAPLDPGAQRTCKEDLE